MKINKSLTSEAFTGSLIVILMLGSLGILFSYSEISISLINIIQIQMRR